LYFYTNAKLQKKFFSANNALDYSYVPLYNDLIQREITF
jgi:hypothetical protein